MSLHVYSFSGKHVGPRLLVLGAIHGNESCGPEAIYRMIGDVKTGKQSLLCGTVTFIPVCNPQAFAAKQRYVDTDLNRLFGLDVLENTYEAKLAQEIKSYIEKCDFLLDIHSLSGGNEFFLFKSDNSGDGEIENRSQAIGFDEVITGWDSLYKDSNLRCTDDYARYTGAKGICIECGHHTNPDGPTIAYEAILSTLQHFGIIEGHPKYHKNQIKVHMEQVVYKQKPGEFAQQRNHKDMISTGTVIVRYDDGDYIVSEKDQLILLPKSWAKLGGEWFYLGKTLDT